MQVQDDVQKKSKKKKTKATNVIARYGRYSKVFENYYALFCFFEKSCSGLVNGNNDLFRQIPDQLFDA